MLDILKSMLNEIKKNSLFPMFSHKNISIVGVIVISAYLIRINHYSINISIENGLTILIVSYISGIFYITLWVSFMSLGWAVLNITNKALVLLGIKSSWLFDRILKIEIVNTPEIVIRSIFALIFFVFILFLPEWKNSALATFASACLYMMLTIFALDTKESFSTQELKPARKELPGPLLDLLIINLLITPISMASIYNFANIGELIDKTMGITGIRIENKDIYIKAPYGELFAANSRNTAPVGNNFIILKNATILLNDIGGETLISYGDAKTAKRLSVPSSYVSIGEIYDLNKDPSLPREPSAVGSQK